MAEEIILTDDNFDTEVIKSDTPVLVDFWATWCPPCRMVAPVIDELAEHYDGKMKVAKCDVDECPKTAQRFNISAVPTILLFKGGEVAKQFVGASDKASFIEGIDPNL